MVWPNGTLSASAVWRPPSGLLGESPAAGGAVTIAICAAPRAAEYGRTCTPSKPLASAAAEALYDGGGAFHAQLGGSLHLETSADPATLLAGLERWVRQEVRPARLPGVAGDGEARSLR